MSGKRDYKIVTAILFRIFFALAMLSIVVITKQGYDNDVWFHLAYGQHYTQNLTTSIDHSQFSWTQADRTWNYVTWIGSSTIYIIYSLFSFGGVFSIPEIVLCAIFIIYLLYIRSGGLRLNIGSIALFFLPASSFYSHITKPAAFSSLFFAACLAIFFIARDKNIKTFWWYPVLFIIWVNTHGGFIFGLFFLCSAFAFECISAVIKRKCNLNIKSYLLCFGGAIIMSFFAICINPHGIGYLSGIFHDIINADSLDPAGHVMEYTSLWQNLNPSEDSPLYALTSGWNAIFFFASFVLVWLFLKKKDAKPDLTLLIVMSIFFAISLLYLRLLAYFGLVYLFAFSYMLAKGSNSLPLKKISLFIVIFSLYFAFSSLYTYATLSQNPQLAGMPLEKKYPVLSADFLKKNRLPAPIINEYGFGGYMIWALYPEYKVFVDPRYWPYRKDVLEDCFSFSDNSSEGTAKQITSKYPEAKTIFIPLSLLSPARDLLSMPEWKLVYFDHNALIFVRKADMKDSLEPDYDPSRFNNEDNPAVLMRLFRLYNFLRRHEDALKIRNYYELNVRTFYALKESQLHFMYNMLLINRK
jgi:hypothetical protein